MEDSDDALWQLTRKGDREAFGELFRRHHRAIYNYCFRRVGDWSSAEDLVSIVFLEAWRKRTTDLLPGKVLPWLYGVATNVLRNRHRAERRYADALRCLPVADAVPDFVDDAAQRLDDQRLAAELLARLSQLPRRDQDVLTLCGWSGLTYEETAFALGVPVGTVRSRLSRARSRFRELEARNGHSRDTRDSPEEAIDS